MSLRGRGIFRFSKVFLKSFLDGPLGFLGEAGWFSISVVSRRADLLGFANSVSEGGAGYFFYQFCRGTLLKTFLRILLYVTDDYIAMLYICEIKFSQIEGNG